MGRYQQLYKNDKKYYCTNSPVIIEASAIEKDTIDNAVIVHIKIRNIDLRRIVACKVTISSYEINGSNLIETIDYSYLDLAINRGEYFGSQTPIYVPNDTRKIDVAIKEIVFENGELWKANNAWKEVESQILLKDIFNDLELVQEYQLVSNCSGMYVPVKSQEVFLCSCGAINKVGDCCYQCQATFEKLNECLDEEFLKVHLKERIARQQKEEEERLNRERIERETEENRIKLEEEKLAAKREIFKKKIKCLAIVLSTALILGVLCFFLLSRVYLPYKHNNDKYNEAVELLNNCEYDAASEAFGKLGNFKDSAEKASEAIYAKADKCFNEEKYAEAILTWKEIIEFSDSKKRIKETEDILYKANYEEGINQCESGNYTEGLRLLGLCEDYEDVQELIFKYSYKYAKESFEKGDYNIACTYFERISGYENADTLYIESKYLYGEQCEKEGKYTEAITAYTVTADYKDSKDRILECKYLYVKTNYEMTDTNLTYNYLKELQVVNYKDSAIIFNELSKVKVKIVAINDSKTSNIDMDSINRNGQIVFHYKIVSGIPDKDYVIESHLKMPGYTEDVFSEVVKVGEEWYRWYDPNSNKSTGTATITIYDSDGNKLCSDSVYLM